jgi:hypothetical protein
MTRNIFLVAFMLVVMGLTAYGQESFIKDRWNVKITGAPEFTFNNRLNAAFFMTGLSYGFHDHFEAGLAIGAKRGLYTNLLNIGESPPIFVTEYHLHSIYNIHLNYHLLPYLVPGENIRFDVYLTAHMGGSYISERYTNTPFGWHTFLGGGVSYYFTRNFGINAEMGREMGLRSGGWNDNKLRLGVVVKF